MAMVRLSEGIGVAFNLAYTWLYLNGTLPLGYAFAALGAVALGWACWQRNLQAETALHGFYLVMAGVGAWLVGQGEIGPPNTMVWAPTFSGWRWVLFAGD